jgi:hypothetical protein
VLSIQRLQQAENTLINLKPLKQLAAPSFLDAPQFTLISRSGQNGRCPNVVSAAHEIQTRLIWVIPKTSALQKNGHQGLNPDGHIFLYLRAS